MGKGDVSVPGIVRLLPYQFGLLMDLEVGFPDFWGQK